MLAYKTLAKQCRIVAKAPETSAGTARLLATAARLLEHQAQRCVLLASRLEKLEAKAE